MAALCYQRGENSKGTKAVEIIRGFPNMTIVDVTADMAVNIAETKVKEKLSIADATVLISALELKTDRSGLLCYN